MQEDSAIKETETIIRSLAAEMIQDSNNLKITVKKVKKPTGYLIFIMYTMGDETVWGKK